MSDAMSDIMPVKRSKSTKSKSSSSSSSSTDDASSSSSSAPAPKRRSSSEKKPLRTKSATAASSSSAKKPSRPADVPGEHPYSKAQHQLMQLQPSEIKNKMKRKQMWLKVKAAKEDAKTKEKKKRKKEVENGEEPSKPVQKQKTLDNTRESDETVVQPNDEEILADESIDEFSKYFNGEVEPKIIITSCYAPTKVMYEFIRDLLFVFPNSFYYKRMNYTVKQITEAANKRGYTDIIIINEDKKTFNALTHVHLPEGPTNYYKLSNVVLCKDIEGHGRTTSHQPEVILNNFNTRLGHRVGRMLGSLFHQVPNFKGRRVVTFHNQRDFIFFRHHRYVFESKEKARLQQLGPKFTLKLRWMQHGTFDTEHGEMEWIHKKEMDTSRRRFFL